MSITYTAIALCAVGAEKTVSNEIKKLSYPVLESAYGRVRFKADLAGLYKALMGLRAADRVLLETGNFDSADFDSLYDGIYDIPWEDFIPIRYGIKIAKVRSNRSQLGAQTSIQSIVHKAAADRLCEKRRINRLPVNTNDPELRVYIEKNKVSVLLDLSGDPLFKRGYRIRGMSAPLRETTAAAIILHSMWRRKFPLYDPFCGSGTIAIEAAMYAWDMAPCMGRNFAISHLPFGNAKTEKQVREEFLEKVDFTRLVRICGSDSDDSALAAAKGNFNRAAGISRGNSGAASNSETAGNSGAGGNSGEASAPNLEFLNLSMEDAKPGLQGIPVGNTESPHGYIITNPPYGRRLGTTEEAEEIYREMGRLSNNFKGWKLSVISEHSGFESFFGRKADSCREISNGAIRTYFYQYEEL